MEQQHNLYYQCRLLKPVRWVDIINLIWELDHRIRGTWRSSQKKLSYIWVETFMVVQHGEPSEEKKEKIKKDVPTNKVLIVD